MAAASAATNDLLGAAGVTLTDDLLDQHAVDEQTYPHTWPTWRRSASRAGGHRRSWAAVNAVKRLRVYKGADIAPLYTLKRYITEMPEV